MKFVLGATIFGIVCIAFLTMSAPAVLSPTFANTVSDSALFDDSGRYVMRNYDDIKPNSNFLAGLGGLWGVPMVRLL